MRLRRETDVLPQGKITSRHVTGKGPAVVCVHGAGVSSRQNLPLLEVSGGVRETWALDLPGFGASTATEKDVSVGVLAEAVLDWLRAKDLTAPCLLGTSMGTQVVVEAAVRAPDDVGSLVLVGPTVDPQIRSWPLLVGHALLNNVAEGLSILGSHLTAYREAGTRRVVRSWSGSRNHRIERVLPKVDKPALVLRGGKDMLCSQAWAEEVTRLLPHGRLVTVPGEPHGVSQTAPHEAFRHIDDFLRKVKS